MSMVINLVEDHNIYLCEGGPVYNGGVQPTPITYLTQWRMMGNSVVHTDEYLTQWKVSGNSQVQQYLTQWKVEGNSVVDNNAILSCGDLGQDGKYHVKISDGVNVYDIALTEPLRKVNDVADSIELINGVATLTRNIASILIGQCVVNAGGTIQSTRRFFIAPNKKAAKSTLNNDIIGNILCPQYDAITSNDVYNATKDGISVSSSGNISIYDTLYATSDGDTYKAAHTDTEIIYELATPTTETIQAPQISVSPTYTSANTTPYSSFTYANPLIYSCGDYSDVDGKYHVKISNGVTIYDIPLTEPLRKVGDVADSIEFVNGSAVLTRKIGRTTLDSFSWIFYPSFKRWGCFTTDIKPASSWRDVANILCTIYNTVSDKDTSEGITGIAMLAAERMVIYDSNYTDSSYKTDFEAHIANVELIYEKITPITETIQVSPFPVSATDTYTSANDTPYSAFEYKKNVEIWSCGEYNATDGKYHILVQPLGGSIADIALDEPLRKVNNVADTIEFTDGVATLTRYFQEMLISTSQITTINQTINCYGIVNFAGVKNDSLCMCVGYTMSKIAISDIPDMSVRITYMFKSTTAYRAVWRNNNCEDVSQFQELIDGCPFIYELATPTTETIQVPQIQEADSYSCVISQGGKAVSWSEFLDTLNYLLTDNENNLLVDSENYQLTVQS